MPDEFSKYYQDYLEGTYDCVDRIVLNAYYQMGQSPGGFRTWWRQLKGDDKDLDNAHLMRMAGRLARRVRAHAKAHDIPVVDCKAKERKHTIAAKYLPEDPNFVGVFVILVGRAPAPVWNVQQSKQGNIVNIERKQPYPYVKHYYFHIMDPDWGHLVIRMSGHPPWGAQIILNGHEYVAQQAYKINLSFEKEGNCFTDVAGIAQLDQIAETLRSPDAAGLLEQVCERWIYSACLCFALSTEEQQKSGFRYNYSVYQAEYSRNLLFQRGRQMEQLFDGIVERTRPWLDVERVKTIFGRKHRPFRHKGKGKKQPRFEVVVETPKYDLTIFKVHFGKLTVKLYTKGERVLRCEAVVHNTKALSCGRSLPKLPQMVAELKQILERFLDALQCVDSSFLPDGILDELSQPGYVGKARLAGIDLSNIRMRAVMESVISLAASPKGFTVSVLAVKVREILGWSDETYKPRHASYDLRKLRAKNWVRKIGKSRRYEIAPEGLKIMTALLVLREKIIKPVLSGAGKPKRGPKPKNQSPLDIQYRVLQTAMLTLFGIVGIAI
ncbi:MAG: hypothetical protein ISR59_12520 [Anaerolineales bacterium]|nr:hypothetical protein [Anaerolineales bacterium]